ncbi:MAG: hypothetical protein H6577_15415 [Lewinellaceae bacterium]|nr:hypothetical protein [Saprospiraceae bacterium]MCB9339518.1 hypothetical protein [Lewinellaceae bacterium]
MKRKLKVIFSCLLLAGFLNGQDLPISNLFLFQLEWVDSILLFQSPQFLTDFNKLGYNNQPQFLSNTELLVSSALQGENQTDIYLLDLEKKTRLRVTQTPESEYSPRPTPDNLYFSVVRVETDADRTQRLWQYPLDRRDKGKPVFKYLRGVGYYYWLDRFRLALFNVATTNYLTIGDTRDESTRQLAPDIGRCFQTSPNGRLVYVHKIAEDNWVIKAMDPNTLQVETIIKTPAGSEDFVILRDGSILMGKGSRIYKYHPLKDTTWVEMAELKNLGIYNVTRMAVSGDNKLVVVNGRA